MNQKWKTTLLIIITLGSVTMQGAQARERKGRLGVGMSNQFINGVPAISLKLQRSSTFGFAVLGGLNTDSDNGGMGMGGKVYKILFEEPNLNFFIAAGAAFLTQKINSASYSGFQIDLGGGSEFNFPGVESLGFSLEFGLGLNKLKHSMRVETMGSSIVVAGAHFYL
ncbi:MAG: hypothetical protein HOE90_23100 [Bacteriovoracaceae bacterium]|jgi:hypothetical protein|nr:hypothetical protein [Bacteriovoracaceae bacterium]